MIRLLASLTSAVGVNVAAQVIPPSLELTALSVPVATVRSALAKPVEASLKVIVTVEVAPMARALWATTLVAVGSDVSSARVVELGLPRPDRQGDEKGKSVPVRGEGGG